MESDQSESTEGSELEPKLAIRCPVCLDYLNHPIEFECHIHTVCMKCLYRMESCRCPVCRMDTKYFTLSRALGAVLDNQTSTKTLMELSLYMELVHPTVADQNVIRKKDIVSFIDNYEEFLQIKEHHQRVFRIETKLKKEEEALQSMIDTLKDKEPGEIDRSMDYRIRLLRQSLVPGI